MRRRRPGAGVALRRSARTLLVGTTADAGAGVGKTKRVAAGGMSDTRNDVMLYAIVQADSHDAAARLFEGHPHLQIPQASIEVMELNPLPGG